MKKSLLFILALLCVPLARGQSSFQNPLQGPITSTSAACAVAGDQSCVWQKLSANAAVATVQVSGTFSATLTVEANNGGANFTTLGTITTAGTTSYVVAGFTDFRVRASAYTSGTAFTTINSSPAPSGGVTSGTADPTGNACTPNQLFVRTTTGALYTCKAGVFAISSGGASLALQTNGVANGSQTTLNLANGGGVTVTDNGTGTDTIAAVGCQSSCPYVLTTSDQVWVQASAGTALGTINTIQAVKFYNNATRGLGNGCFRITTASAGGHVDIGVYSLAGALLWHTGAQLTTSATSICTTPTPVTLAAGTSYYIAWTMDNTTAILATAANTNLWQFTMTTGAPAHTSGIDATDVSAGGVLPSTIAPANIVNGSVIVPYVQVFL